MKFIIKIGEVTFYNAGINKLTGDILIATDGAVNENFSIDSTWNVIRECYRFYNNI